MKIFVTGGTGFIGSHFLNQAHAAGHDIVALRRSPESRPRISLAKEPMWLDKPMDEIDGEDFSGCEALVHLAAHTPNVPYDTLENCLYWNLNVTVQLVRRASEAGVRRIIAAGSCFEYGLSGQRYDRIPVDAPLEPTQSYPASKAAASIALIQLARELELDFSLLRIFQVYGPGESESRLWPSLKKAALSGADFPMTKGEQIRDFTPVEFVANEFVAALNEKLILGTPSVRHLGTGKPQTLVEFSKYWWSKWNACGQLQVGALPYRQGEVMCYIPKI